ncbi:GNAT family N-acetyltransferase [Vibrio alginolyticus]|uniref:GNAT family N-acetyltransferase n=1 Tax=Vibrio TaxID=662 RepID=UPI0021D30333|nr:MULTISPECIES: GNAT family N-acetyltransferase [unclassified Vibrio]ELB1639691.1 GNAT family N-acetyltransferase [Vibrio alginolyticus]ELB2832072.1 GNAT family N-acetyltransferase [Vibrio alginolyticus]ELB2876662.1 GNAT family N-acetyltransferase [Vibrio alginolyticus]MDW1832300.1 GNAT family protein [Vibrio sp. Vb1755]MDW2102416.1 GNAT family protein [Vibrio sp. 1580]
MIKIDDTLYYRYLKREDLAKRVSWINNPDINDTLTFRTPVTLESTERWFDNIKSDPTKVNLFFFVKENDKYIPIGFGGFVNIDTINKRAELFITIGEASYQGCGYGYKIVKFLTEFGFNNLDLNRIFLTTLAHNLKARSLYIKCGYQEEGYLKKHFFHKGEYKDCFYMASVKEQ